MDYLLFIFFFILSMIHLLLPFLLLGCFASHLYFSFFFLSSNISMLLLLLRLLGRLLLFLLLLLCLDHTRTNRRLNLVVSCPFQLSRIDQGHSLCTVLINYCCRFSCRFLVGFGLSYIHFHMFRNRIRKCTLWGMCLLKGMKSSFLGRCRRRRLLLWKWYRLGCHSECNRSLLCYLI